MDRDVTLYPSCTRTYVPSSSSSRGDENWGDDISKEERMVEKRAPSKSCVLPPVLLFTISLATDLLLFLLPCLGVLSRTTTKKKLHGKIETVDDG